MIALRKTALSLYFRDYTDFMEELEEDADMRSKINIYKNPLKFSIESQESSSEVDEEIPTIPIDEMLEDLVLDEKESEFQSVVEK